MTPIPAVVPPLPRARTWKRNVAPAAAFDWLSAGWRDFTIDPAAAAKSTATKCTRSIPISEQARTL